MFEVGLLNQKKWPLLGCTYRLLPRNRNAGGEGVYMRWLSLITSLSGQYLNAKAKTLIQIIVTLNPSPYILDPKPHAQDDNLKSTHTLHYTQQISGLLPIAVQGEGRNSPQGVKDL